MKTKKERKSTRENKERNICATNAKKNETRQKFIFYTSMTEKMAEIKIK